MHGTYPQHLRPGDVFRHGSRLYRFTQRNGWTEAARDRTGQLRDQALRFIVQATPMETPLKPAGQDRTLKLREDRMVSVLA